MRELLRRIGYLWNRRRLEREMADEMAYHRELMAPDRRTDFGSDLRLREDAREIWGWAWLDRLRQDLVVRRPRAPQFPRLYPHRHARAGIWESACRSPCFVRRCPTFREGPCPTPIRWCT